MTALDDITGENEYKGKAKKKKRKKKHKQPEPFLADEHQSTSLLHHVSPISTKIS